MNACSLCKIASWILQLIAAVILAQTLVFKFTGAAESKYIFTTLGAEPWGRIASGCAELVAILLLLAPRWAALGALLSLGLMAGAIASHLTKLGIVVQNDGGLLFLLAWIVFASSAAVLVLRRREVPLIGPYFTTTSRLPDAACGCRDGTSAPS